MGSVEFRLAMLHYAAQVNYRRAFDFWVAGRLQNIFYAVSVGKLTDESAKNAIKKSNESRDYLFKMLDPYGTTLDKKQLEEVKTNDTNSQSYMDLLSSGLGDGKGFSSLDQLITAVNALNQAISDFDGGAASSESGAGQDTENEGKD